MKPVPASNSASQPLSAVGRGEVTLDEQLRLAPTSIEPIFRVFSVVPVGGSLPGKSIAMMIARGLAAHIGGRVLLVDARLDEPVMKLVSEGNAETGLTESLAENGAPFQGRVSTVEPGLFYLPRGNMPAPALALVKGRMAGLLAEMSSCYTMVILLCDPVTDSITARILASLSEKALLIAREDSTLMEELERCRDILHASLVPQVEVVLEKPHVPFLQRCYAPPLQALAAVGSLFAGIGRGFKRWMTRFRSDQGAPTTFPWPKRGQEPSE